MFIVFFKEPNIVDIIHQHSVQGNESNIATSDLPDKPDQPSVQVNEHAVLVNIKLSANNFLMSSYYELEDRLEESIIKHNVGELDGNGIGEGYWTIYMYGPDADKLFEAIEPIIKEAKLPRGSYVIKRYGEPGAHEDRIYL